MKRFPIYRVLTLDCMNQAEALAALGVESMSDIPQGLRPRPVRVSRSDRWYLAIEVNELAASLAEARAA